MLTNNLEYHERVQTYINAGRASVTDKFHHRTIGFNYRLGEFQAAVLTRAVGEPSRAGRDSHGEHGLL